jgi:hypothetical protein
MKYLNLIFVLSAIVLAFYFNSYKLVLIENLKPFEKYPIFPWSTNPILSNSSLLWLRMHIGVSLTHVGLTGLWVLDLLLIHTIHSLSHAIFTFVAMSNLLNFGNMNPNISLMINGGLLIVLSLIYLFEPTKKWKLLYFIVLLTPVWFEILLLYKSA